MVMDPNISTIRESAEYGRRSHRSLSQEEKSPPPDLVVEREKKHRWHGGDEDDTPEFYDHLAKRMRKYYRTIFNVPKKPKTIKTTANAEEDDQNAVDSDSDSTDIEDLFLLAPPPDVDRELTVEYDHSDLNYDAEVDNEPVDNQLTLDNRTNSSGSEENSGRLTEKDSRPSTHSGAEGNSAKEDENDSNNNTVEEHEIVSNPEEITKIISETTNKIPADKTASQSTCKLSDTFTAFNESADKPPSDATTVQLEIHEMRRSSIDTTSTEGAGVETVVVSALVHDPPKQADRYGNRSPGIDLYENSSIDTTSNEGARVETIVVTALVHDPPKETDKYGNKSPGIEIPKYESYEMRRSPIDTTSSEGWRVETVEVTALVHDPPKQTDKYGNKSPGIDIPIYESYEMRRSPIDTTSSEGGRVETVEVTALVHDPPKQTDKYRNKSPGIDIPIYESYEMRRRPIDTTSSEGGRVETVEVTALVHDPPKQTDKYGNKSPGIDIPIYESYEMRRSPIDTTLSEGGRVETVEVTALVHDPPKQTDKYGNKSPGIDIPIYESCEMRRSPIDTTSSEGGRVETVEVTALVHDPPKQTDKYGNKSPGIDIPIYESYEMRRSPIDTTSSEGGRVETVEVTALVHDPPKQTDKYGNRSPRNIDEIHSYSASDSTNHDDRHIEHSRKDASKASIVRSVDGQTKLEEVDKSMQGSCHGLQTETLERDDYESRANRIFPYKDSSSTDGTSNESDPSSFDLDNPRFKNITVRQHLHVPPASTLEESGNGSDIDEAENVDHQSLKNKATESKRSSLSSPAGDGESYAGRDKTLVTPHLSEKTVESGEGERETVASDDEGLAISEDEYEVRDDDVSDECHPNEEEADKEADDLTTEGSVIFTPDKYRRLDTILEVPEKETSDNFNDIMDHDGQEVEIMRRFVPSNTTDSAQLEEMLRDEKAEDVITAAPIFRRHSLQPHYEDLKGQDATTSLEPEKTLRDETAEDMDTTEPIFGRFISEPHYVDSDILVEESNDPKLEEIDILKTFVSTSLDNINVRKRAFISKIEEEISAKRTKNGAKDSGFRDKITQTDRNVNDFGIQACINEDGNTENVRDFGVHDKFQAKSRDRQNGTIHEYSFGDENIKCYFYFCKSF